MAHVGPGLMHAKASAVSGSPISMLHGLTIIGSSLHACKASPLVGAQQAWGRRAAPTTSTGVNYWHVASS
jgi:hypothetical protein